VSRKRAGQNEEERSPQAARGLKKRREEVGMYPVHAQSGRCEPNRGLTNSRGGAAERTRQAGERWLFGVKEGGTEFEERRLQKRA